MLSSAAGVRGQSLILEARGHHSRYMEGLLTLQDSVGFAEQAGSWTLCMSAAGHFWNACLPLLDSRRDRRPLRGALEIILKNISRTYRKHTAGKTKRVSGLKRDRAVMGTPDTTRMEQRFYGSTRLGVFRCEVASGVFLDDVVADDDLKLWAAAVSALLHIHVDAGDWRKACSCWTRALGETPHTQHRL
ncbi:cilia- and flagella-associated protein 46-like [Puntigrus tetrazona]|uniref:cilia- and flagella-associated protein 46-like n=1 Tax=Puntigrus tetrazona TaxID=1606681 RepID=UPI001C893611|nr:cilia- and flagella-associated protein 46-like [Puntigrus tetrazona]